MEEADEEVHDRQAADEGDVGPLQGPCPGFEDSQDGDEVTDDCDDSQSQGDSTKEGVCDGLHGGGLVSYHLLVYWRLVN